LKASYIKKTIVAVLCSIIPLSASALEVQVTDNFGYDGFQWDQRSSMHIRYSPVMHEGVLYICGAYSNAGGGASLARLGRQAMREARITMGGQTIARNMSFFRIVSNANVSNGLVGTTADCDSTGLTPTQAQLSTIRMELREGRYRVRR
jgi:hypothetical protein